MTWKQFARSIEVSHRRAQREAILRQRQYQRQTAVTARETARRQKQWAKEEKWLKESGEAAQFEQYMDALVSLHTEAGDSWDWQAVSQMPPPEMPAHDTAAAEAARFALENFRPGFFARVFGGAKAERAVLEANLRNAIDTENTRYAAAQARHVEDRRMWETNMRLAPHVLRLSVQACAAALKNAGSFEDIQRFGTSVQLESIEGDAATVGIVITNDDLVPQEEVKMTASGKLSTKSVPVSKYWGLYQEHVCSCALRVALETFAVIPVRRAIVNVARAALDSSTGHMARTTILAIHIAREDLDRLNLDAIEPSAAMKNFPHRMSFKKTTGFSEVSPMSSAEQWASS